MAFRQDEIDQLLAQTGRKCCLCPERHSIQVHHIVPKAEGGTDEIDNAIPLCPTCHAKVHLSYAPGGTTRAYSYEELKLHRDRASEAVKNERARLYDDRIEELVQILEFRAAVIEKDLQRHYRIEVQEYLSRFLTLHKEHIAALRQHQYVLAHEILKKINEISYSLETSEVGLSLKHDVDYAMLGTEHYSWGALMCEYVAGDLRRKSKLYPGERVLYWIDPEFQKWNRIPGIPEDVEERYLRVFFSTASLGRYPI